jgi:hypothetical protein
MLPSSIAVKVPKPAALADFRDEVDVLQAIDLVQKGKEGKPRHVIAVKTHGVFLVQR